MLLKLYLIDDGSIVYVLYYSTPQLSTPFAGRGLSSDEADPGWVTISSLTSGMPHAVHGSCPSAMDHSTQSASSLIRSQLLGVGHRSISKVAAFSSAKFAAGGSRTLLQ